MKSLRLPATVLTLLGFLFTNSAFANNDTKPTLSRQALEVLVDITQDGELISQPSIIIAAGRRAELSWSQLDSPLQAFRVLLLAEPINPGELKITAQIMERSDQQWTLKSEPQIIAARDATVSFRSQIVSARMGDLVFGFTISPVLVNADGETAACAPASSAIQRSLSQEPTRQCALAPLLDSTQLALSKTGSRAREDCCSVSCSSNGTLTCCGAISCCDRICGACCSPP